MNNVFIGTERSQFVTQRVLEFSIQKFAEKPVQTRPVRQRQQRVGGTNFGFVRFTVPSLMGFRGKAAYLDADQVVLTDINGLFDALPIGFAVGLVNQPEGNFGGKQVGIGNQTSVMSLDCSLLADWKVPKMFERVVSNRTELLPGQIHYRDFMALTWYDQSKIHPIDPSWNHFNIKNADSKLVHFSHVRSQPWKDPRHELSDWWNDWLIETVRNGFLSRGRLWFEIQRGNVHKKFRIRKS